MGEGLRGAGKVSASSGCGNEADGDLQKRMDRTFGDDGDDDDGYKGNSTVLMEKRLWEVWKKGIGDMDRAISEL
jgi:hypothetical protein